MSLTPWEYEWHADRVADAAQREARSRSHMIQAEEAERALAQLDRMRHTLHALTRLDEARQREREAIAHRDALRRRATRDGEADADPPRDHTVRSTTSEE